jgi:hypothetical protein
MRPRTIELTNVKSLRLTQARRMTTIAEGRAIAGFAVASRTLADKTGGTPPTGIQR